MGKLTKEKHRERHFKLHKSLDELFADYIEHHPNETEFTQMPLIKLMEWSHKQTTNPDESKESK